MESLPRSRVLYVDDDQDTCEMVRLLFSSHKVEVCCADSAADAALKIKTAQFDLLMLDVWLPGLDGLELCRQVRRADSDIPILFYSGAAYETDIAKGLAAGANAYLVKPDIDGLTRAVLSVIEKRSTTGTSAGKARNKRIPIASSLPGGFLGLRTAID